MRLIVIRLAMCLILVALTACSLNPLRRGDARVVERSVYCGTTSQQSAAHYFANEPDFAEWIEYRGIMAFDADSIADNGAIVVEMGQRPTGGYDIELMPEATRVENGTLKLGVKWTAPPHYAAISQALTAPCMVITPPKGDYARIVVVDQLGHTRGTARVY